MRRVLLPVSMPLDATEELAARFGNSQLYQRASHAKIEWRLTVHTKYTVVHPRLRVSKK